MESITCTYYCVAGHTFAVYSKTELLGYLSNYAPFEQTQLADSPIFSLQLAQDDLLSKEECAGYVHVFTDNANSAEADMPRIEVYENGQMWLMRVSLLADSPICCEVECDKTFEHGTLRIALGCQELQFCIDTALMLMYAFRTAPLMTLVMHAAVVVRPCLEDAASVIGDPVEVIGEDRGYLFLGHSGMGKSTHARMWLQAFPDTWLLNDDNPILRVMEDGEVRVYGSPWSGKTPCYTNAYARVGGIVKLSQAPHNRILTVSLPEAYAYMLSSSSGLKIERGVADALHETIVHVITHVACRHLECLPDTEAAEVCWGELTEDPHQLPLQGGVRV